MVLTNFVHEEDTVFYIGYSYIASTGVMIFVNLGRLMVKTVLIAGNKRKRTQLQKNHRK